MFGGMIIKPSGPPLPYMAVDSGEDENDEIICLHHPDGYTIYACRAHRRERCNDCMTDLSPGNQMSRQDFLSTKAKAARRGETDPNSAEYQQINSPRLNTRHHPPLPPKPYKTYR